MLIDFNSIDYKTEKLKENFNILHSQALELAERYLYHLQLYCGEDFTLDWESTPIQVFDGLNNDTYLKSMYYDFERDLPIGITETNQHTPFALIFYDVATLLLIINYLQEAYKKCQKK